MVKHRKQIRLKNYDYSQSGLYFITICTQNRECLFGDIVGARRDAPQRHKIFQRNYYEHIIRNENDLNKIREYIKTNPIFWKNDINNLKI